MAFGTLTSALVTADLTAYAPLDAELNKLEKQLADKRNQRELLCIATWDKVKRVRASVRGIDGDDSTQYELIGGPLAIAGQETLVHVEDTHVLAASARVCPQGIPRCGAVLAGCMPGSVLLWASRQKFGVERAHDLVIAFVRAGCNAEITWRNLAGMFQ